MFIDVYNDLMQCISRFCSVPKSWLLRGYHLKSDNCIFEMNIGPIGKLNALWRPRGVESRTGNLRLIIYSSIYFVDQIIQLRY